jgi:predicted phage baseplate assembly protein
MSDLVPVTPSPGLPALPYRPGDRGQFLAQLLAGLASAELADGRPFGLRTLALSDPTVALLDAWATVADVIAFYQERIASEGFLRTATQPGSLLAIAQLTGYRPRPGLAASVWLAYRLQPDPADTAVVLPGGLLAQSVPGTGELPQTFETTAELVARPSWNTLPVRTTGPVTMPPGGVADLTTLSFRGVTTGLTANTVILLGLAGGTPPAPVVVQAVSVDMAQQVTSVTLQPPPPAPSPPETPETPETREPREPPETPAVSESPPATSEPSTDGDGDGDGEPTPVIIALDALLPALRQQPAPPPASAAALNRSPRQVFARNSDALPRLVAALDPALSATLYKALGSTPIGQPLVTSAQALRAQAMPFGVRMPPRPVFNNKGQQVGTEEWPIGAVQTLGVQLTWQEGGADPTTTAQVSVIGSAGAFGQAAVALETLPVTDTVGSTGSITVSHTTGATATAEGVTFSFTATQPGLRDMTLTVTAAAAASQAITLTFDDGSEVVWVPGSPVDRFSAGNQVVTVVGPDASNLLSISVAEALPVADPAVLDLDTTYPGIVPSSWVVIEAAGPVPGQVSYPVVAQVTNVSTVAVARYGMSGTVTELTLSQNWVDPCARWLSAIRPLSVRAQPADLTLLPVALPRPLSGSCIELDGLYPGIEAGQFILVTGTRTGLPGGASIAAGEAAMVANVTQQAGAPGDTPHTTVRLAAPLTYSYDLASVQVYGNVVPAHQGATITEPLAGAVPGDPHPTFTLSQAPVLADPSPTAAGSVSSLTLTVGGRTWTPVTRLDPDTPAESYLTGLDSQGRTTIELSGPLPTGTSSVVATYRAGQGSAGNVRAHQVTQLLSRPLAVAAVDNPLPGSGGSDGDGPGDLRAGAPVGLTCLDRLVSVADAADLVRSWAGVGKATAVAGTDGHGEVVVVTVAGVDPVALDPAGALCTDLAGALAAAGHPDAPVLVVPATLYLIVLAAQVRCDRADAWPDVSAALQSALFAAFGYPCRQLGEDVVLSDITAIAHTVAGVVSFTVTAITLIPSTATASQIQNATAGLVQDATPGPRRPRHVPGRLRLRAAAQAGGAPPAAAVAFLYDAMPDTLVLQQEMT